MAASSTTTSHLRAGIIESVASSDNGTYTPALLPLGETFAVKLVTELMCDGRPQHVEMLFLPRAAGWEVVRQKLQCWGLLRQGFEDAEVDGKKEGWVYQVFSAKGDDGLLAPEPGLRDLRSERDLEGLRRCAVESEGKREVLIWRKHTHTTSQRLKAAANEARDHGEVDFFNVLELDVGISLGLMGSTSGGGDGGGRES